MIRTAFFLFFAMTCALFADPCPSCNEEVADGWKFCPKCGAAIPDRKAGALSAKGKAEAKRDDLVAALRELKAAYEKTHQADKAANVDTLLRTLAGMDFGAEIPAEDPDSATDAGGDGKFDSRVGGRQKFVERGGGSTGPGGTERAVTAGLRWLARHQGPGGNWSAEGFDRECGGEKCAGPGYKEYDAGCTGLALLAFLGAGYTHLTKESYVDPNTNQTVSWGLVIKNGIKWLITNQDQEGCFGGRHGSKYMYNHAIAAMAMAEAYGMTNSALFKASAQKGIDFILDAQNPRLGWRYSKVCGDSDTSVTAWCVMALKSADMAGLTVGRTGFDGARAWLKVVTDEQFFKVGYTAKGTGKVIVQGKNEDWDDHEALTAAGMACRAFIDADRHDPALEGGAKLLVADLPVHKGKKIDYYYWYYGSLALFQFNGPEGKYWKGWNEAMKEALVPHQHTKDDGCAEGSWDVDVDRWGFEGGRVYATALNTLTLETYYRYPIVFGKKK